MHTLYTQDHKPLGKKHTIKALKHLSKRHPSQYLYIADSNGATVAERNAGTWRRT